MKWFFYYCLPQGGRVDSYTLQQSVVFSWCLGKEMKLRMMLFLCNATYAPVFCFFVVVFLWMGTNSWWLHQNIKGQGVSVPIRCENERTPNTGKKTNYPVTWNLHHKKSSYTNRTSNLTTTENHSDVEVPQVLLQIRISLMEAIYVL